MHLQIRSTEGIDPPNECCRYHYIDGAFTTRRSRFLHEKQESENMMILTSVLANLGSSSVGSLYLVPRYCPAR